MYKHNHTYVRAHTYDKLLNIKACMYIYCISMYCCMKLVQHIYIYIYKRIFIYKYIVIIYMYIRYFCGGWLDWIGPSWACSGTSFERMVMRGSLQSRSMGREPPAKLLLSPSQNCFETWRWRLIPARGRNGADLLTAFLSVCYKF